MNLSKHVDENGRVRVLRVLNDDGTSYGGFHNSLNPGDKIVCPDWEPTERCGNGLHGWPWGRGRCDKAHAGNKLWQVVLADPHTGVDLGSKAKWPEFEVLYTGEQAECMKLLLPGLQEWVIASTSGDSSFDSTSGEISSASTSGKDTSASASGYGSSASASARNSLAITSGWHSSASTSGDSSFASTSGYSSSASTSGDNSSASTSNYYSSASTSGTLSSASTSSDYSSASTSGPSSSASTSGPNSSASASGLNSYARTSGDGSSASTSGRHSSASTSGNASAAVCNGIGSEAKSGPFGCIVLCWHNETEGRNEIVCGAVGNGHDNKLKPNVWYCVNENGEIVPATND